MFAMCSVQEIRPTFQAVGAIVFWSGGLQFHQWRRVNVFHNPLEFVQWQGRARKTPFFVLGLFSLVLRRGAGACGAGGRAV